MKTSHLQKVCIAEWDKKAISWTTIDGCIGVWSRFYGECKECLYYIRACIAMNGCSYLEKGCPSKA